MDNRAFRWACNNGHLAVAQWLVAPRLALRDFTGAGLTLADVRACDNWAFRAARANGHQAVAQWLREIGSQTSAELVPVAPKKDTDCPICIAPPIDAVVVEGHDERHGACRLCLEAWLAVSRTCPVCRAAL